MTDMVIRKGTGQEYTFGNFVAGIAMGAGFAGTLSLLGKQVDTLKLKQLVRDMEANVKESKDLNSLKELEFEGQPLKNLWIEQRQLYYKGQGKPNVRLGVDVSAPLPLVKIPDQVFNSQIGSEVFTELQTSTKKELIFGRDQEGYLEDVTGISSTFPDWVPKDLRLRTVFDEVQKHLLEGTVPTTKKASDLYRIVQDQMMGRGAGLDPDVSTALKEAKGLSEKDIVKKYPDINLKRDVPITDIYGNKITIPEGEALTPYELKGNKILLQDGETYIVSKNQWQNIKGNATGGEAKEFAPELKGTEETMKGTSGTDAELKKLGYTVEKDMSGDALIKKDGEDIAFEDLPTDVQKLVQGAGEATPTKYSQYQLPGGENYKEILIKAPQSDMKANLEGKGYKFTDMPDGTIEVTTPSGSKVGGWKSMDSAINAFIKDAGRFQSSHWDEPNVISHLRMNERTFNGKKVSFMEELQSDWAREGRSNGFAETYKLEEVTPLKDDDLFWRFKVPDNELQILKSQYPTQEKALQYVLTKNKNGGSIPNNPLLKNWQEPTIKRALQEAVANDSKYFAWISGEQTSARYNLATQVDDVNWESKPITYGGGSYKDINLKPKSGDKILIRIDNKDGVIGYSTHNEWVNKTLDEVLGKGLADKIMAAETGTLSGEGLKFGGEWAANLYDKQVKSIVEKLTGGKVEVLDMGLSNGARDPIFTKIGIDEGGSVSPSDLKAGLEIANERGVGFVVTEVLGEGKFKAIQKSSLSDLTLGSLEQWKQDLNRESYLKRLAEKNNVSTSDEAINKMANDRFKFIKNNEKDFDISTKKSAGQQGIELTPEIVAKIKGEAPQLKKPSGKGPLAEKSQGAEEFIANIPTQKITKSGEPVLLKSFHGTDKQFEKFSLGSDNPNVGTGGSYSGKGIYFTPNEGGAKYFAGENGRVIESYLDLKKPYVKYLPEDNIDWQFGSDDIAQIKANGHDSIIVRSIDRNLDTGIVEENWINEIVVFDTSAIKTKQEITDAWAGSNGVKTTTDSLGKDTQPTEGFPKEAQTLESKSQEVLDRVPVSVRQNVLPLAKIIQVDVKDVKNKVNAVDYLRTPDRVLKKIGLEKESNMLQAGYNAYVKELPKNIDKITAWSKQVPVESNERIFKYLDGQEMTLNPKELEVAGEIKGWLKDWAKRLKLPEDKTITNYITHVFDAELLAKEFDEDLAKIITDKIPGSVYDPFLLERLGAKGYKQDVWGALDAYVKRGTRKFHMDEPLEAIQDAVGRSVEESKVDVAAWKYVEKYIAGVNMRPTNLDNLVDNAVKSLVGYKLGSRPVTTTTKFLRQMTYRGMLGLNVGSAFRNLSQGVNTYAVLGEKYTAIGYTKLFSKGSMKELADEGILSQHFIQDRVMSSTKKGIEKMDKVLFAFFEGAEKINRGAAYFGAKSKALGEGKSLEDSIKFAKEVVKKTQFTFGSVDTPVALQSDIIKTLTQFQSFTLKQTEFLTEMVQNKNFAGLLRYAVAGIAFTYTVGQAFGMEPADLIPGFRLGVPPSLKFPVEVGKAALNSPDKYGNERTFSEKAGDIAESAIGLIPAGNQAKKTIEGVKSIQDGGSYTSDGKLQFKQDPSFLGKAQSVLFGKYAGQNAKDYFGGETAAEMEHKKLSSLPAAEANLIMAGYKISDPALYEAIKSLKEDEKLGVTDEEKSIRSLGIASGERALAIAEQVEKLETKEEKNAYIADLKEKKVINMEGDGQKIIDQLKAIRDAGGVAEYSKSNPSPVGGSTEDGYNQNISIGELKYEAKEVTDEKSMIELAKLYSEAAFVDPLTAIQTLFTDEQLKDVRGGTVIMERIVQGIDPDSRLDHIVPLELGGDNSDDNLRVVSVDVWAANTPVENYLGGLLDDGLISEKQGRDTIIAFKNGELTAEEVKSMYE